jgi:DNA polymerase sigma
VNENGKPIMVEFIKSAFISKTLDINILLANDFLELYGANVNYETKIALFEKVGFRTLFKVIYRVMPYIHKVIAR